MRACPVFVVAATLVGAPPGCAPPPAEPGETAQAIINGTIDPGDPAVVLVVIAQPMGSNTGSLCSSSVISPHLLLTAAHCLSPDVVGPNAGYRIFTAPDFRDMTQQTDPKNYLDVLSVHPHPMFDGPAAAMGALSQYDIGVVVVKEPLVPAPLRLHRQPLGAGAVGQPMRMIGYGETNATDVNTSGTRYQVTVPVATVDPWLTFNDGSHNTCHGDSGGPALMTFNGGEEVVGVHIWVPDSGNCAGGGYETRVDQYLAFIDSWIAQIDPSPDMAMAAPADAATTPDAATPNPDAAQMEVGGVQGGCAIASRREPSPIATLAIGCALLLLARRRARRARARSG